MLCIYANWGTFFEVDISLGNNVERMIKEVSQLPEFQNAFEAEGLDPWRYGVLCWDEWWSAEVEIPAETTPIMEEVEEEVIHMVTVDEPVLDEHGEPTGEVQQVEKEVIELVKKQVETGELEILMEARTELQVFTGAEDAAAGAEYHNRQGVRYDELFAFILAAI